MSYSEWDTKGNRGHLAGWQKWCPFCRVLEREARKGPLPACFFSRAESQAIWRLFLGRKMGDHGTHWVQRKVSPALFWNRAGTFAQKNWAESAAGIKSTQVQPRRSREGPCEVETPLQRNMQPQKASPKTAASRKRRGFQVHAYLHPWISREQPRDRPRRRLRREAARPGRRRFSN